MRDLHIVIFIHNLMYYMSNCKFFNCKCIKVNCFYSSSYACGEKAIIAAYYPSLDWSQNYFYIYIYTQNY